MDAVLLSGGIDSISLAFWKKPKLAITIDYGQKSFHGELRAASYFAQYLGMIHEVIRVDCSSLGSGDLSNNNSLEISPETDWWPFRNQMILTFALIKSLEFSVDELMIGCVSSDNFFKDSTLGFIEKISALSQYQEGSIRVTAPAISLSSNQLVEKSRIPRSILSIAHSCHTSEFPCGECRGCNKHIQVMNSFLS